MARYRTTVVSSLPPGEAFAYLTDFTHALEWDPSVSMSRRVGDGPIAPGTEFDLVARFGGRDVPLRYTVLEYEPPRRAVLEARRPDFVSRDTLTFEPAPEGSTLTYDALLEFQGLRRLLDPVMHLLFRRVGDRARAGMQRVLNP